MTDFVTGLREDLVEAAAREAARAPHRRPAGPRLRPQLVLGAAALAAVAAVLVVVLASVAPAPRPAPAAPRVVTRFDVGGSPGAAAFAGGALWLQDDDGTVRRVDPRRRRVTATAHGLGDKGIALAARGDQVWALGAFASSRGLRYELLRLDPRTGAERERHSGRGEPSTVALGRTSVWTLLHRCVCESTGLSAELLRRDTSTGRLTATVKLPETGEVAAGGGVVWELGPDGTVTVVDEDAATVVRRFPRLVATGGGQERALAPDGEAVWVADAAADQLIRLTTRGVAKRVDIGPSPGPFAVTPKALWVVTGDRIGGARRMLNRVDPRSGRVTGVIDLGAAIATAVVAAPGGVWVVDARGRVTRVSG